MPNERNRAFLLFASLGLNIFLGSVLTAKLLSGPERASVTAVGGTSVEADPSQGHTKGSAYTLGNRPQTHQGRTKSPHRHNPDRHDGPGDPKAAGPSDLALLRQMIRIMGGPKDPRIASLHEERRDQMQRVRSEMQDAHERVHETLTADALDEAKLSDALKHLRKTAFESQARAQEGILTLAKLMTPEERAKLHKLRPDKTLGSPRGQEGRPSLRKMGPQGDKGPHPAAP